MTLDTIALKLDPNFADLMVSDLKYLISIYLFYNLGQFMLQDKTLAFICNPHTKTFGDEINQLLFCVVPMPVNWEFLPNKRAFTVGIALISDVMYETKAMPHNGIAP